MTELNLLGRTIGRFEIRSELGRGGMAVVYCARQTDLERTVALKVLPPAFAHDKSYTDRFLLEARSAAALEHPHIVPIYEVGAAEGLQYIAMKYIAGHTLKDVVQAQGAFSLQQAVSILEQVAEALDYAHSAGMIHRDIKPSNIMVAQNGWVYLTDFGLARGATPSGLTMTGTVMGTPEYMSPEQAQGLTTIGPSTDIYALGVVLYEILTANMPFQADTPMGMLVARLQYAPRPPRDYRGDLPLPVEDVIMRALARKPEARYATAGDLIRALKAAAGLSGRSLTAPAQPVSPPQGIPQPASRPQPNRQPVSPPFGLPPTQPAGVASSTPPYVKPAVNPTVSVPRTATPAMGATAIGSATAMDTAPATRERRPKRGLLIGAVLALVLLLAVAGGAFLLLQPRVDPKVTQGLLDGKTFLGQKDGLDKAIAAYKSVLAADPNNATAHTQLALIYNLRSRSADAETEARAAIKTDSTSALAQAMLAEALNNQGEYDDASAAADRAIANDEKASSGYAARSTVRADRAAADSDKDMLQEAAADADKALALSAAEDDLSRALAHSARGYVYWQQYSLEDDSDAVKRGVEEFNRAIGLQSQFAVFHSNLGYFYDAQDEHDQAKEKFEAALDADDQYGHAHAGLGWNLYYLDDYTGALGEFDKAIAIDPNDTDAYVGKSRVFQNQDKPDYDQAIDALNRAAGVAPKSPIVFSDLGWAQRNKANSFEYGSDDQKAAYAEAEKQFHAALDLNKHYVDALTGLGWVLQDQAGVLKDEAKYQEAIETLQKSLAIKEEQPYAHNAIGWSYYGLKQYDQAEVSFRRATELKSDYADAYYGLGEVLEAKGKTDDARQAYQTAVEHGSSFAKDALDKLK